MGAFVSGIGSLFNIVASHLSADGQALVQLIFYSTSGLQIAVFKNYQFSIINS